MQSHDPCRRCLKMIRILNREFQWGLDRDHQERYAQALVAYMPATCTEAQLRAMMRHYHTDHSLVEALRDRGHPQHHEVWADWMHQVLPVLHRSGLFWSSDCAVDIDDLAQIARMEVLRSIESFRYQSRFSTWTHRVVVQGIQRHIRDSMAQKRAVRPDSLEQLTVPEVPIALVDQPETIATDHLLIEQIGAILADQPDARLQRLFHLWALDEKRIADIGAIVHLHPSRVRALLQHIRQLLYDHPDMQAWRDASDEACIS